MIIKIIRETINKIGSKSRKFFAISLSLLLVLGTAVVKADGLADDKLYLEAYSAIQNAILVKTQKSINNARTAISELSNTGASWAIGEFSKKVDQLQQPILVKVVQAISNAQTNPSQANINNAQATIDTDLPIEWKNDYSSAIDVTQQKLMKNAEDSTNKALQSKAQTDIDAANTILDDIETSTNTSISSWASNLKAQINTNKQVIKFKDRNLEQAVRSTINKQAGDLYDTDVQAITRLNASGREIADLSGIENLTSLQWLALSSNQIKDISPLKSLSKLTYLSIDILNPTDISWLTTHISNASICGTLDNSQINDMVLKINEILGKIINPDMSQVDKELAIHDYIVANTDYDVAGSQSNNVPLQDFTAYEVLINRKGVCLGYAKAFALLCNFENIPCQVVEDDKINHAWNIVRLQDCNYYQVDTTWDDPVSKDVNTKNNYLDHDYFNLSDKQMFSDHDIDEADWSSENYPKCNVDSDEFYSKVDAATNGEWIYTNESDKLYAINASGDNVLISNDNASNIIYYNNWIYYINTSDEHVYRIDTSGENCEKLIQGEAANMCLYGNSIYYLDTTDWNIYKLTLDEVPIKQDKVVKASSTNYGISNGYLYYKYKNNDGSEVCLHKLNLNSQEDITISKLQSTIQIYGIGQKYIYYKLNNDLYRMTTNGENSELIVKSVESDVEIFNDWIYYQSTQDEKWYKIKLDGMSKAQAITLE